MKKTTGISRPPLRGAVLLFLDRKRPGDLGIYTKTSRGGAPSKTPHIDALFRDGFVFAACHSAGSSTEVAFPTIYTSTYAASRHHRRHTLTHRAVWFSKGPGRNLLSVFSKAGFKTTVVTNRWYAEVFFKHPLKKALFSGYHKLYVGRVGDGNSVAALEALVKKHQEILPREGRFLTVFHLLPQSLSALGQVDALVGRIHRLLKRRGRLEDTVVLLTADHGVQLREHGRTHYGFTLFDEEIRVPLLIRVPGLQGKQISEPVSSVDHFPSLVDLFQPNVHFQVEGSSYLPALYRRPGDGDRVFFAETRKPFHSVAAMSGALKLIYWFASGAKALFHRDEDPDEVLNRIGDPHYARDERRLWEAMERFLRAREEFTWP